MEEQQQGLLVVIEQPATRRLDFTMATQTRSVCESAGQGKSVGCHQSTS